MSPRQRTAVRLRPKTQHALSGTPPRLAVFTAIDGTLLDSRTFDPGENRDLVRGLVSAGVSVIPVSVLTAGELEPIAAELGLREAMIVEAGGAIARWRETQWEIEACGPPAETLLDVIREIEDRSGARLLVPLSAEEATILPDRPGDVPRPPVRHRFSEPFVIESGTLEAVRQAAASIGFSVRPGRRFLHLCRECDEGEAFTRVREELRCETTIAVGGSPVDAEFLSRADVAIVIPGSDGEADAELLAKVPHARVADAPAPEGWRHAVEEAWQAQVAIRRQTRPAQPA